MSNSKMDAKDLGEQLAAEGKVPTAADIMAQVSSLEQDNVDSAITAEIDQLMSHSADNIENNASTDEAINNTLPTDTLNEEENVIIDTDPTPTEEVDNEVPTAVDLSDSDQKMYESAYNKGWRPQEEFVGDPDKWVNYDEFERRQPLFDELSKQRKAYKNLEKKMESVLDVMAKQQKQAQEAEIAYARQLRNEAIELGDVEQVNHYDNYIAEKQEALRAVSPPPQVQTQQDQQQVVQQQLPPETIEFIERNSHWWNSDSEQTNKMRNYAVSREQEIRNRNPMLPLTSVYTMLERDIQKVFNPSQKASNKSSQAVSTERATKSAGTVKKSLTAADMSPEQKRIFNMLSKDRKKTYFDALVKTGEIGGNKKRR